MNLNNLLTMKIEPLTPVAVLALTPRTLFNRPWLLVRVMPLLGALLVVAHCLAMAAAHAQSADKTAPSFSEKYPHLYLPPMDDRNAIEFLKAKLAQADKWGGDAKLKQEYRACIAELTERVAKGPSDSAVFESNFKRFLLHERDEFNRRSDKNPFSGIAWKPEVRALCSALRVIAPRGKNYFETEIILSADHSKLMFGRASIDDVMPLAKRTCSVLKFPEEAEDYLWAVILFAGEPDKETTIEGWIRRFELRNNRWGMQNFAADAAKLKEAVDRKHRGNVVQTNAAPSTSAAIPVRPEANGQPVMRSGTQPIAQGSNAAEDLRQRQLKAEYQQRIDAIVVPSGEDVGSAVGRAAAQAEIERLNSAYQAARAARPKTIKSR